MSTWWKTIFINAIQARMVQESRTADDIILDYTKLTEAEKTEILSAL